MLARRCNLFFLSAIFLIYVGMLVLLLLLRLLEKLLEGERRMKRMIERRNLKGYILNQSQCRKAGKGLRFFEGMIFEGGGGRFR